MSGEIDLIKLLNNKEATDQTVDNLGHILGELDKYNEIITKVGGIINRLDKSGVLPALLRVAGAKTGADIDKPLPQSALNIESRSPIHATLFKKLNELPDSTIENMLSDSIRQQLESEKKNKKK